MTKALKTKTTRRTAKPAKAALSTDRRRALSEFATKVEEAAGEVKCLGEMVSYLAYAIDLAQLDHAEVFYGIGHAAKNAHRKLQGLVEAMLRFGHGDGAKGGAS